MNQLLGSGKTIYATGGGAFKFEELIRKELQVELVKVDEMKSLQLGLTFILERVQNSAFEYTKECRYFTADIATLWPLFLVLVGSGVSIIKINGKESFQRVSGMIIGGGRRPHNLVGTLMGLANMLLGITDFEALLELSVKGDNGRVDSLIRDLATESLYGMKGEIISSSFSKAASAVGIQRRASFFDSPSKVTFAEHKDFNDADVAKSLVCMIASNIAHLSCLCSRLHNVTQYALPDF